MLHRHCSVQENTVVEVEGGQGLNIDQLCKLKSSKRDLKSFLWKSNSRKVEIRMVAARMWEEGEMWHEWSLNESRLEKMLRVERL